MAQDREFPEENRSIPKVRGGNIIPPALFTRSVGMAEVIQANRDMLARYVSGAVASTGVFETVTRNANLLATVQPVFSAAEGLVRGALGDSMLSANLAGIVASTRLENEVTALRQATLLQVGSALAGNLDRVEGISNLVVHYNETLANVTVG